ncbi:MAG: HlyD family efflux transporter periplasmic adaptor subunit [Planctomycetaceae bacterium]
MIRLHGKIHRIVANCRVGTNSMPLSENPNVLDEGGPVVDAPAQPLRVLLFSVIAIAAGVAFTGWIESGGRQAIPAYLQVRTVSVTAEQACRVERFHAVAGGLVTIGDALVELSDTRLQEDLSLAAARIEELNAELAQVERRASFELALQQSDLDERICQLQLQVTSYQRERFESELRRNLLADVLASHETALWDTGDPLMDSLLVAQKWPDAERMSTMMRMETASQTAELIASNVEICEERLKTLRSLRSSLADDVRAANGVEVTRTRLKQAQGEHERLAARQTRLQLCSPAVGQVGRYRARPGDQLQPGDPIVELLDDSQRYLIAEVPSRRIHEFTQGRTVWLLFPGDEKRQGRVAQVAPQTRPRDGEDDPVVEVEIEMAGRLWPQVPIGTRIDLVVDDKL